MQILLISLLASFLIYTLTVKKTENSNDEQMDSTKYINECENKELKKYTNLDLLSFCFSKPNLTLPSGKADMLSHYDPL